MTDRVSRIFPGPDGDAPVLLAVDGSSRYCSLAVGVAGPAEEPPAFHVLAEITADLHRAHAERLLPLVEQVMDLAGLTRDQVTHLVAVVGPGSFTGLRVALAAWKGLALAWHLPLVGVSTLRALALQCPSRDGWIAPMLDAKMGEVFGAVFRWRDDGSTEVVVEEQALSPGQFAGKLADLGGTVYALGDGLWRYGDVLRDLVPGLVPLSRPMGTPRASTVGLAAVWRLRDKEALPDPSRVNPVYLRASQAEAARASRGETVHDGTN
ncbi:MAG TPA: tRNA (adenosine(37)-N6)-threonylcarbamoyltransferase complex dimerization subunit type 1 TsaB [Candidatus Hydrogenedentes bacterium]|nr:tRNA (adenosine(37)-N6)-threonylcarbamoyltransferase complex dimerization subunit type 1 TsaB [Candidatus Hydrogenedentota bacterium]